MSVRVPVQTRPFERDVRAPGRLAGQRDDPLIGSHALLLRVDLPVLVLVETVMPIRTFGGKAIQSARLENDADGFGRPVLVKLGVAGHRPLAHAGNGAE